MKRLILFMHVSLDGFVALPTGELDWIKVDDAMFEYVSNLTSQADTALYGRVTYEMMESYWPTAADKPNASKHDKEHAVWYKNVAKVVLSKTMKGKKIPNTQIISENIPEQIQKLKQRSGKNILIFGSPGAVHTLMEYDLIDEYWLFVNPILLSTGIPLFANIKERRELHLIKTKVFESGVIGVHYEKKQ